ncbi:PolC-type DNA polymerase III [Mechercharimyces sp. CAU 1602]|uniref:PolC-type DNA polymerase III n=1 Tax=Mechercharimyces sp. CAU 1602 TaxID=2973933 RepID=UPI00216227E4|nr:PolC-type DNA polymerase III [Mechercharimyces sp. CAU 1602]MCS1351283.1 PolC-type DNA polymerase III [Mechercharimyces sp. CAU 1602]
MSEIAAKTKQLQQIFTEANIPSEWMEKYFVDGYLNKVQVSRSRGTWTLYLCLNRPVPPDILHQVKEKMSQKYGRVARVSFVMEYVEVPSDQVMTLYWQWIIGKVGHHVSQSAAGWLAKSKWHMEENTFTITFSNPLMMQMAQKKQLDQVVSSLFFAVSGTQLKILFACKEGSEEQARMREHQVQEEREWVEQAITQQQEIAAKESYSEEATGPISVGYEIREEPVPLHEIQDEERRVVVKGAIFKSEVRELRSGRTLLTFNVTDYTDSILVKVFARDKEDARVLTRVQDGLWVKVRGSVQYDTFARDLVIMANDLQEIPPMRRQDQGEEKRVELHLHTSMSAMDGVYEAKEMVKRAADWGHPAVAITDHGVVQAFPEAYAAGKKHGVKIIYGMEAYVVDDGVPIVTNPSDRPLQNETYVVFDVETTGLSTMHDSIIELAAVKMRNGEIIDRFESFSNPHRPLSNFTTELTGITNAMVKDAPEIAEVLTQFQAFIEGTVLVAHNARFDMGFLQEGLHRIEAPPADNPVIDTLELGRALYPGLRNYRLNTLCKRFDISLEQHHRAIYDAEATGYLMWKMISDAIEKEHTVLQHLNNLTKDRDLRKIRPFHAVILVQNQTGLKNLYRLISKAHLEYFHQVPRIPRSQLALYREGLLLGSGCEKGELYEAALQKSPHEVEEIAGFYDYLEIQPIEVNQYLVEKGIVDHKDRLREANRLLVEIGEKLGKPVVATANVHYLDPWDHVYREILAANQGGFRRKDPKPPTHFRTTDEMLQEFSYLGEEKSYEVVIQQPKQVADQIEELKPFPDDLFTPIIEGADEELRSICYQTAEGLYGSPLPEVVEARLEKELGSIIKHGFAVIYLISHKLVTKSLEDGYLVGSRGSVGSSFVATMSSITEVNPLPPHYVCPQCQHNRFILDGSVASGFDLPDASCPECESVLMKDGHDIPFETFLGFQGDKVPDIDLNFSGEYQPRAHQYTEELFGKEYVYRAGTISTVAEKTAFGYAKKYEEELGQPMRGAELERMVHGCKGVKRTTGQHPGGLMVVPQNMDVFDFTPIQRPADDVKSKTITTHFDYHAISGRLLKLDILGHDDPTVIRMLQDLTDVDPKTIPVDDPAVMKLFSSTDSLGITQESISSVTGTLGIPEFGTRFVRQMLEDTRPTTFGELVRISGLSHGTDVWLNNAQDLIRSKTAVLTEVISTRDDIMVYLMHKGMEPALAFKLMEKVRKGKGLTEEEQEQMREHDVPEWYIDSCLKIKYMFPKAHAVAYVMMAVRIAWFKVHYPIQYYATYFSVRADDFDLEVVAKGAEGVQRCISDIEEKGVTAPPKEKSLLTVMESVREMMARGLRFQQVDLYRSHATHFLVDGDSLIPPFSAISGVGANAARNIAEARTDGEFLSIEDFQKRTRVSSTVIEILRGFGCFKEMPESNQMSLF